MKVFLSWSGERSHKVACELRKWLRDVIQALDPYVSSEDIDKGTRWSTDVSVELEAAQYGILCVTHENVNAPWLNFEAGALSKSIEKSNVTPFLIDIKRSDIKGPLLQFQSTIFEKADVYKMLESINTRLGQAKLAEMQLSTAFEVWWPILEKHLLDLEAEAEGPKLAAAPVDPKAMILEEMLELLRYQHRALSNPESILPAAYLGSIISQYAKSSRIVEGYSVAKHLGLQTTRPRVRVLKKPSQDASITTTVTIQGSNCKVHFDSSWEAALHRAGFPEPGTEADYLIHQICDYIGKYYEHIGDSGTGEIDGVRFQIRRMPSQAYLIKNFEAIESEFTSDSAG